MQRIRIEQPMADAIAVGRIWHYGEEIYTPSGRVVPADGRETERQRFTAAVAAVRQELERLAATEAIFAAHLELTEDPMLAECVEAKIADGATAADALHAASEELSELFAQIDDEYLRSRADDVRDICRRIRRALQGAEPAVIAVRQCGEVALPVPGMRQRMAAGKAEIIRKTVAAEMPAMQCLQLARAEQRRGATLIDGQTVAEKAQKLWQDYLRQRMQP